MPVRAAEDGVANGRLNGRRAGFPGADAHDLIEIGDEDLAVADATGLRRDDDELHHLIDLVSRAGDLDLELGQEMPRIFGAAEHLGAAALTAIAANLGHSQADMAELDQRVADVVEL